MKIQKITTVLVLAAGIIAGAVAETVGRRPLSSIPAGRKYIALTFDDGPNTNETVQILDELKRISPDVKVTFYINGVMVTDETRPVLHRAVAEGHDIDNHGYYHYSHGGAHPDSREILSTPEAARENIQRNSQLIFDETGYWPFSFRAPFFEFGSQITGLDRLLNMIFVHAIYDTNDWSQTNQQNPEGMAAALLASDRVRCGTIILMHDAPAGRRQGTVDALKHFIPQLLAQGYEFVTVRELFAIKQVQPELFSAKDTWNPNPRAPFNADNNGGRWSHVDFWPDNNDDWWLQDWWTCPTPPWERDLSQPCDADADLLFSIDVIGGTATATHGAPGETVNLTVGTAPEGKVFKEWRVVSGGVSIVDNSFIIGFSNIRIEAVWQSVDNGGDDDGDHGDDNVIDEGEYIRLLPWEWAGWDSYVGAGSKVDIISDGKDGDLVAKLELAPTSSHLGLLLWLAGSVDFSGTTGIRINYSADRDLRVVLSDTTSYEDGNWSPCGATLKAGDNISALLTLEEIRAGLPTPSSTDINGLTFYHSDAGQSVNLTVTDIKIYGANFIDDPTSIISDNFGRSDILVAGITSNTLNLTVPNRGIYTISVHSVNGKLLSQTEATLSAGVNSLPIDAQMARGAAIVSVQGENMNMVTKTVIR